MATATIPAGSPLERKKWGDKAYAAMTSQNPFFNIMSSGMPGSKLSGAFLRYNLTAGEGTSVEIPFRALLASAPVLGENRVQGTGRQLSYSRDIVSLGKIREALTEYDVTMSEQRTAVDVENDTSEELGRLAAMGTTIAIMTALLDTTTGRTANRYQYGALAANYNASHTTAMANVDSTDDKLTLTLIRKTMTKIKSKSSGVGFMRPADVITNGEKVKQKFIGLFHPNAILDLKADAGFQANVNYKDSPDFDVISGSNFVGEYEGLWIYEFLPLDGLNDMLIVAGAGTAGATIAHNLILGANAVAIAEGQVKKPKGNTKFNISQNGHLMVTTVDDDHGADAEWAYTKVEGYKKLVDNTISGGEDFGVFHLFTDASAGF